MHYFITINYHNYTVSTLSSQQTHVLSYSSHFTHRYLLGGGAFASPIIIIDTIHVVITPKWGKLCPGIYSMLDVLHAPL